MRPNVPKRPLETGDNPPATTAPEPTSERSDPTARERCPPSAAGDPAKTQHQPSPSRHPTQEEAEEGDPATEDGSGPDPNQGTSPEPDDENGPGQTLRRRALPTCLPGRIYSPPREPRSIRGRILRSREQFHLWREIKPKRKLYQLTL